MKTCIFCKHLYVSTGHPGYSEMTPGWSWAMECLRFKWEFDPYSDDAPTYRKKLSTADTCADFEEVK